MGVASRFVVIAALGFALSLTARLAAAEPAVVYDMGGKFDKSFNQAAFDGAERYKKDTGEGYRDFEPTNDAQREQAMRRLAKRGADPIVAIGFSQASAVKTVASQMARSRPVPVS